MDLIYFYSSERGAPAEISRNLFSSLLKINLPFNIKVFPQNRDAINILKNKHNNIDIISYNDLFKLHNPIVHISVSPLIFPNRKFLLHLISILRKNKLILNYQGDPRTEIKIKLQKMYNPLHLIQLTDYIFSPYLMQNAKKIIVNSFYMQELMSTQYNLKNIIVIPNAIEGSWLEPTKAYELEGKTVIFYHGRLAPEKGVDILINAFSKIVHEKSLKTAKLYIAGDGPMDKYLKSLTKRNDVERYVTFLGMLSQCEIKSYLMGADAAIYPSTYEPFSLAILEAFSTLNGPVYYSNKAGINDFIKSDGYTFNSFSPIVENIYSVLNDILENKVKDTRLIDQQKQFAKKYTWDKVCLQYVDMYKSISNIY